MKLKKLLFYWAFLDIERTYDIEQTYYKRFSDEIQQKNLTLMRALSAFFVIVSAVVVLGTSTIFAVPKLRDLYLVILAVEIFAYVVTVALLRARQAGRINNVLCAAYLVHLLGFAALIGTVYSPEDSAAVFLVAMLVAQMIFILPPVCTVSLTTLACIGTVIASAYIKAAPYRQIDALNCSCVLLLSSLLGWKVSKMRAEEAFARAHALRLNEELKRMDATDRLTGLPNHRGFQDAYAALYRAAQRAGKRLGVIMVDIDQLKSYNAQYGLAAGDHALTAVGDALSNHESGDLFVCRFGGEDFIVLLKDADCPRAMEIAEDLRAAVQALQITHALSESSSVLTVSIGVCVGQPVSEDASMRFVHWADRAMHRSKADGGNCVTNYDDI